VAGEVGGGFFQDVAFGLEALDLGAEAV